MLILKDPSPQKKLLPKVSHTQQVLGSLVITHTKFQEKKLNKRSLWQYERNYVLLGWKCLLSTWSPGVKLEQPLVH
jgi:hypothetical protein